MTVEKQWRLIITITFSLARPPARQDNILPAEVEEQ